MNRDQRAEMAQRLIARFRQLKAEEGWTQDTLVEESGVPERTVSDVLRGVSVPNPETLEKLAAAVGLTLTPEQERDSWPDDVKVFLDVVGLFLVSLDPAERRHVMRDWTKSNILRVDRAAPVA